MADRDSVNEHLKVIVLALMLSAVPVLGGQVSGPLWPSGLTLDDRRDITELAKQVGIGDLQWVSNLYWISSGKTAQADLCPAVRVESRPQINGTRALSHQLLMRRVKGAGCSTMPFPPRAVTVGDWLTVPDPKPIERRRFTDGDWNLDVYLGPAVTYADAETVIRAIRRRQLIDRRSETTIGSVALTLDVSHITRIEVGSSSPGKRAERERVLSVEMSNGIWLKLAIVGGTVELRDHGVVAH